MPSLFVIQGWDQGKRFDLDRDVISIGRDAGNAISLNDSEVSRNHARLTRQSLGHAFELADLGSSNGTFVNSQRVESCPLKSGDRVQVGRTLMIFTAPDEGDADESLAAVDIVPSPLAMNESRIVKSLGQEEGSRILADLGPSENQWLARARSNLQVMYRTALAVSHTLDIDELLGRILELIFEWVEADRGCIMLVNEKNARLEPTARRNRPGLRTGDKMSISQTILDYVMENREGVLTSDAQDDQRWDTAASIIKLGVREAIAVPMQGRYGIVGVIYIDTYTSPGQSIHQSKPPNRFHEEHLKLMIAIGHQAALAVEDTSYYSAMVQSERLAAIGQTIAGLSHHIKNILQGIRGGSYLIEEGLNVNEAEVVRKGWRIVEKNQEKISRLVLDMLTFSKQRQPDVHPADLTSVVADVVELMQSRADERSIELLFQPDADLPQLCFDGEGIHHAALNVVTNAIDACENQPAGRVVVQTGLSADRKFVEINVTDNGEGIAPEDLEGIFRLRQSTKGNRGTGLGLSVSQKILQEHGGQITVSSKPGQGSCFALTFPVVLPEDDGPADRPTLADLEAELRRIEAQGE
ncbi:MAG: FHA domain-containing protein [Planctomycetales bacterium]|nr:FHA domain-containing protein [Planctomycetales bacterium]